MTRYWLYLIDGSFGWASLPAPPIYLQWVTIWETPPGGGKAYKVYGQVDRMENGNQFV